MSTPTDKVIEEIARALITVEDCAAAAMEPRNVEAHLPAARAAYEVARRHVLEEAVSEARALAFEWDREGKRGKAGAAIEVSNAIAVLDRYAPRTPAVEAPRCGGTGRMTIVVGEPGNQLRMGDSCPGCGDCGRDA